MEKLAILQEMFDQADKYNLKMECIVSMLNHLMDGLSDEELQAACNYALCEWDI